jgi:hypothetical protein
MLALPLLLAAPAAAPTPAALPAAWPVSAELLIGADAASDTPPDFKRQLVRHRERLMAGIRDAAATERGTRDAAAHRAAAARGTRQLAAAIREHRPFSDVAYEAGGIVHEAAAAALLAAGPADAVELARAARRARFLGYTATPFADPEVLAASSPVPPGASPGVAYDAAVTTATRLFAWVWKAAGGDASIVSKYPELGGPYVLRGE